MNYLYEKFMLLSGFKSTKINAIILMFISFLLVTIAIIVIELIKLL